MAGKLQVLVWNEGGDRQKEGEALRVYPEGLHRVIADALNRLGGGAIEARTALLDDADQGVPQAALDASDVLVWWGHCRHSEVSDESADRVCDAVRRGLGIVFLHSAHKSKPFMRLLGTSGRLSWREADEKCRVWVAHPSHPIAEGLPSSFVLEKEEMYSEPFGIPEPDATVLISWFAGGNVFRSGVTFEREAGRLFYFQGGHETYPTYYNEHVQRLLCNAVKWAKGTVRLASLDCPNDKVPLEAF